MLFYELFVIVSIMYQSHTLFLAVTHSEFHASDKCYRSPSKTAKLLTTNVHSSTVTSNTKTQTFEKSLSTKICSTSTPSSKKTSRWILISRSSGVRLPTAGSGSKARTGNRRSSEQTDTNFASSASKSGTAATAKTTLTSSSWTGPLSTTWRGVRSATCASRRTKVATT